MALVKKYKKISNLIYFIDQSSIWCLSRNAPPSLADREPQPQFVQQKRSCMTYTDDQSFESIRQIWNGPTIAHKCVARSSHRTFSHQLVESVDSVSFLSPIAICALCRRSVLISLIYGTLPLLKNWLCYRLKLLKADKVNSPWHVKCKCSHTVSTS